MDIIESKLKGCMIIEPTIYYDERGFFMNHTNKKNIKKSELKKPLYKIIDHVQAKMF